MPEPTRGRIGVRAGSKQPPGPNPQGPHAGPSAPRLAPTSRVRVPRVVADHPEALDQLTNPVVERERRPESHPLNFLVRDDIVTLIGILADLRLEDGERHEPLDSLTEFPLRQ